MASVMQELTQTKSKIMEVGTTRQLHMWHRSRSSSYAPAVDVETNTKWCMLGPKKQEIWWWINQCEEHRNGLMEEI